ncbi:Sat17 [Stachybotrys chartarum IBT 7711]|uniref:Taurine hydroxylase-like protein SAT17 n=1 Tax=Stachybotrys chartarum (strain CBS 109288 / IBT 7711) TaxID=1280523 RepID=SAT17_STACB|nr:RecName: Full=Taurine hydroxylase-like protein SAT17; AltName: Full=Satratoxin biosynthesis SC3 cluster protein 17 [Stachybotrys chartarum IBT 7711]KEY64045.1 Sat17 [Stachybotrys chartarum IBT 7711]
MAASPVLATTSHPIGHEAAVVTDADLDRHYAVKLAGKLNDEMAWVGQQFTGEEDFVVCLSEADVAEVNAALTAFQDTGLKPGYLSPETFKLPKLGPKLRLLSQRIHEQEGFIVLRGLQPWRYRRLENTIVFTGIASYIGNRRGVQCADGPVMTHIFDYSTEVEEKEKLNDGYLGHANRTSYLPFHTDDGHIISLYCLQAADIGGRTLLASSHAIYNHLLETRPDVIETLKEEWIWDSFIPEKPSFIRPLLLEQDGKLICNYRIRPFLGTPGYPRNAALGPLPAHQEEALNTVAEIAEKLSLKFEFKTGDIQFLNNLSILHAREEFHCAKGDTTRRHLLRLVQMDDELAWRLPPGLSKDMDKMFQHDLEEEKFIWSPEPLPYVIGQ